MLLNELLDVFRIKRWYRNSFMLLGAILAIILNADTQHNYYNVLIAFLSICLIASGNYGINEILDSDSDKHHPKKKYRAIPAERISKKKVFFISLFLYFLGILIVLPIDNIALTISAFLLLITGILYNVKPFRLKDLPYIDFIFESINNPIRLLVGWYSVVSVEEVVPSSFVFSFWFLGMFLMASKRFGEIRFIDSNESAISYRKSFKYYTEEKILFSMIASLSAFMFLFGVICVKYAIDLIIILPLILIFVTWFFHLAYEQDSIVKDPERIFEKKGFLFYVLFTLSVFIMIFYFKFNLLGFLLNVK